MQSCAPQTAITALNVTDPDISQMIASYTIQTAPNSGTLYYEVGGIPPFVAINTFPIILTPAEMATLEFDPDPTFKGAVTFTYFGTDNGTPVLSSNTATYSLVITNCPPTTDDRTNNSISSSAGNTSLSVASGDILQGADPDGSVVSFTINSIPPPSEGALLFNGSPVFIGQTIAIADIGMLSFTPSGSFVGNVTFTYSAKDNDGAVDATPATFTIPIANTPPVAVNITHPLCVLAGGAAVIIDPLLGTDVDGTVVSYDISNLSGGTLAPSPPATLIPPGHTALTFTATTAGTYTFDYTATDNNGGVSNTATYTINVSAAPVANNISTPDIPSSAGSTSIPPATAADDGTIVEFIFQTIPNPVTQGVLYINTPPLTPVLVGDPIAAADISKLEFDPVSTFAGSIVLDYIAEDDCGFSSALATYTINVVGADLSLLKVVNNNSPNVGGVVTFTITVSNAGPSTATDVSIGDAVPNGYGTVTNISDPGSGAGTLSSGIITWTGITVPVSGFVNLSFDATVLAPGIGVSHLNHAEVTESDQFDLDSTPDPTPDSDPPAEDDEATAEVFLPIMTITKTADKTTGLVLGDVITYTYVVTNTGNVSIDNVTVADVHPGSGPAPVPGSEVLTNTSGLSSNTTANDGNIDVLAPGDVVTMTGTYVVTQADLDAGVPITNTATANGTPASGTLTPPTDTETITPNPMPSLAITKVADDDTDVPVGQTVTYTYVVTNTGNVTVNDVTVSDVHQGNGTLSAVNLTATTGSDDAADNDVDVLAPGQTGTWISTYVVAQTDIDDNGMGDGDLDNTATATGTPASGTLTGPTVDEQVDLNDPVSALMTTKDLTSNADGDGSGTVSLNDILTYTVTVTNTGNTTLTNVTVTDPLLTPNSNTCASVPVGGSCVLTGTYTVTQADVDAGNISNTGTGDSDETPPHDKTVITPIIKSPALSTTKSLTSNADGDGSGTVSLGDMLTYTVTNTGNSTLNNVTVNDTKITPNSTSCISLPVGGTCVLVGVYTVTQVDVDAGKIDNTGTGDSDDTAPVSDLISTPVPKNAAIGIVKMGVFQDDINNNGIAQVGETIKYSFTVTNQGNVNLNSVTVTDPLLGLGAISGPMSGEDVGNDGILGLAEMWTYMASYPLTQADINAGMVTNQAIATSEGPSGNPTNTSDDVTDNSDDNSPLPGNNDPTITYANQGLKHPK